MSENIKVLPGKQLQYYPFPQTFQFEEFNAKYMGGNQTWMSLKITRTVLCERPYQQIIEIGISCSIENLYKLLHPFALFQVHAITFPTESHQM